MNTRTLIILVGAILMLGVGVYLTLSGSIFQDSVETQEVVVRLGWVHQGQFAGMYVAQEKGYYQKAFLDVELLELDPNKDQVSELSSSEVDVSIMEAHQLIAGANSGHDLVAVAAIYQINPHALAVRQDSNIYGPDDFKGKIFGLAGGEGEGNALFRMFVNTYSDTDAVSFVQLGFNTVDDFIEKKADIIDVYRIDQPYLAQKKGVPLRVIPLDAYGFSTYGDVIVVHRSFMQNNPEVVQRFVTATLQGWKDALENVEEATSISQSYASGDYDDFEYQEHIITESIPLIRGNKELLGKMDFVPWSTLYEAMKQSGAVQVDIDVKNLYTNEFIN